MVPLAVLWGWAFDEPMSLDFTGRLGMADLWRPVVLTGGDLWGRPVGADGWLAGWSVNGWLISLYKQQ